MGDAPKIEYSLIPAKDAASLLSISLAAFFELASQQKCSFLIAIPDAVEVYIKGLDPLHSNGGIFGRPANRRLEPGTLIRIHDEIEFLCLEPSECSVLLNRMEISKKVFSAVGVMSSDGRVDCIDTHSYQRRHPDSRHYPMNIFGEFLTYEPAQKGVDWLGEQSPPTAEKSIPIRLESLLIRAEDFSAIAQHSRDDERDFGKFEPGPWTSPMLADLNEASTFFSNKDDKVDKVEIKNWFQQRWAHKRPKVGNDVIDQAANAILPDHLYRAAPSLQHLSQQAIDSYNEYASSTLIRINEAAKKYWDEKEGNQRRNVFASRIEIILELTGDQRDGLLSKKMATAVARIIRPDQEE